MRQGTVILWFTSQGSAVWDILNIWLCGAVESVVIQQLWVQVSPEFLVTSLMAHLHHLWCAKQAFLWAVCALPSVRHSWVPLLLMAPQMLLAKCTCLRPPSHMVSQYYAVWCSMILKITSSVLTRFAAHWNECMQAHAAVWTGCILKRWSQAMRLWLLIIFFNLYWHC